jgi:L-serine kinase (ATP) / ParB family transcriptional regulator, heme-responsive regulator
MVKMIPPDKSTPPPDLRILAIDKIHPHEGHDSQRSEPLLKALQKAEYLTNPPIVSPMDDGNYVVMDGANRYHCFRELSFEHLLVQVAAYDSGHVDLSVWQHVISDWSPKALIEELDKLSGVQVVHAWDHTAVSQILLHDGGVLSIHGADESIEERNRMLREIVAIYQKHAKLSRTAITDPSLIWPMYPDAIALVLFPRYQPQDIIKAAQHKAFLPPGVSRHIIHGRALKLNYPFELLRDLQTSLEAKNDYLQEWIQKKLNNRSIRYYSESTYQFDE